MNRLLIFSMAAFMSTEAFADNPFDAVHSVEVANLQSIESQKREAMAREAEYRSEVKAKEAAENKLVMQVRAAREKRAAETRARQEAENSAKREREQRFEDEERALALEEKRIRLQVLKARASRADDYIDAELRSSAANTDVIQSKADASRDFSSGAKSFLEKSGDAIVNESESFF